MKNMNCVAHKTIFYINNTANSKNIEPGKGKIAQNKNQANTIHLKLPTFGHHLLPNSKARDL